MITTTLGALVVATPALDRLLTLRLGGARTYQIAKLATLVRAETTIYHDRHRALIVASGAERATVTADEKARYGDTMIAVRSELQAEVEKAIIDLGKQAVTIPLAPIAFAEDLDLSGDEILRLGALLMEPADPPKAP